ncbi:cysteine-rich small domain-containing protein [Archaeoglobus veneficus]|uniref:Cysteine-rich small domain protein n=1 Tax=Archaeoglobus veneficus (strain DSM 11195 / SNP6) TaxID=693661 RepID=F2KPG9_ARCVS|nr:cysteine-rich small domain-containing protein [Archaeoglobus veneficus]AEA46400.1 cysteine-rich small domain protein [Archaeoglobus veneficus SNP6]
MLGELRERTLVELFGALEGKYGPNYECKYYPCHFSGQDCSLCYCPFYPCLLYDLGGELKITSSGYVWSCQNCNWIHKTENVEDVLAVLSGYSRQQLIEEDWYFFNRILQELYYGTELGVWEGNAYNLMPAVFKDKECEEVEKTEFLRVVLKDFEIESVHRCNTLEGEGVLIPMRDNGRFHGFYNGRYVICKI